MLRSAVKPTTHILESTEAKRKSFKLCSENDHLVPRDTYKLLNAQRNKKKIK